MKRAVGALSLVGALLLGSAAAAGPVVDAATEAEALQAEGKTVEALDALNGAIGALWDESPLAFRRPSSLIQGRRDTHALAPTIRFGRTIR